MKIQLNVNTNFNNIPYSWTIGSIQLPWNVFLFFLALRCPWSPEAVCLVAGGGMFIPTAFKLGPFLLYQSRRNILGYNAANDFILRDIAQNFL